MRHVVKTLARDGLRVRSAPGQGAASRPYKPLLPLGTRVLVLDGPIPASNHPWYQVVPIDTTDLPSGWIASAEEDGEPWVEVDEISCPTLPTDFRTLAELPLGIGLVCFPRVPITVRARLLEGRADFDGAAFIPEWFFGGSGHPDLLVPPDATSPPAEVADWFFLNLDPAGEHARTLPFDKVVEVTGIFDHPAAATCTRIEPGDVVTVVPSEGCRLKFAVTKLVAQTP